MVTSKRPFSKKEPIFAALEPDRYSHVVPLVTGGRPIMPPSTNPAPDVDSRCPISLAVDGAMALKSA